MRTKQPRTRELVLHAKTVAGVSAREIARTLNVHPQSVYNFLSGKMPLPPAWFTMLTTHLKISSVALYRAILLDFGDTYLDELLSISVEEKSKMSEEIKRLYENHA